MEAIKREDLTENIAIIKINKSYNDGLSALELYDITRGCWKRKLESVQKAEYVLAVSFGIVKEVYKVDRWVPAYELNRETIPFDAELEKGRIGFFGSVADESFRQKYIGRDVNGLYKRGEADPVKLFLKEDICKVLPEDINIPANPEKVIVKADKRHIVCPRCHNTFADAPRCPECGQLIKV